MRCRNAGQNSKTEEPGCSNTQIPSFALTAIRHSTVLSFKEAWSARWGITYETEALFLAKGPL